MQLVATVLTADGKSRAFTFDADSENAGASKVLQFLKPGESILSVSKRRFNFSISGPRRLSLDEVSDFCLDLGELIESNIPFLEALTKMSQVRQPPHIKSLLNRMIDRASEGASITANFQAEEKQLGEVCVALATQGEETKKLAESLRMVVNILDRDVQRQQAIVNAVIMPAISMIVLLIISVAALFFMVPMVRGQLVGVTPNALSRVVFSLSDFARHDWFIWLPITCLLGYLIAWPNPLRKRVFRMLKYRIGFIYGAIGRAENADFALIFGSLVARDVPQQQALSITARRFKSSDLGPALEKVITDKESGSDLAKALAGNTRLDDKTITNVQIGANAHNLGPHLIEYAKRTHARADRQFLVLQRWVSIISILIVALGVAVIYSAIQAPMTQMFSSQMQ